MSRETDIAQLREWFGLPSVRDSNLPEMTQSVYDAPIVRTVYSGSRFGKQVSHRWSDYAIPEGALADKVFVLHSRPHDTRF